MELHVVTNPGVYGPASLKLAKLYESKNLKMFNSVPLSTSLIPRHVIIDTKILYMHVLKRSVPSMQISRDKQRYWLEAFDTSHRAFKDRSGMRFNGMIRTDGISCSVLIEEPHRVNQARPRQHVARVEGDYFEDNLADLKCEKVFIDPNRRDLLYCLGSNDLKLRYTSMQRRSETKAKEHDKIRTRIEVNAGLRGIGPAVQAVQNPLPALPGKKTVDPVGFMHYLLEFINSIEDREPVYANEVFRKLKFAK